MYILHACSFIFGIVQFIYDLPERLAKCIKSEAYGDAVKFYTGAMPIFKVSSHSSLIFNLLNMGACKLLAVFLRHIKIKLVYIRHMEIHPSKIARKLLKRQ